MSAGFLNKIKNLFKREKDLEIEHAIPKSQMVGDIQAFLKKSGSFGAATFLYIDVDSFSDILELYGQKSADKVIVELATRIARILPVKGNLSWYKNDEFLVFIPDEDNTARSEKLCQKLFEGIEPVFIGANGEEIKLTVSIGICHFPFAGTTFKELMENLEITTYVSKRDGGNKYTNFFATIYDEEKDNMDYYYEIKQAMKRKEFVLYYQPIIDFKKETICGAEALMRWDSPTKGIQAPQKFIKVMEQSGDIHWVGAWGIDTMLRFYEEVCKEYPDLKLTFSLNLSTKQLLNKGLAEDLIRIAGKHKVKPANVMFEFTDYMIYEEMNVIRSNILALKNYGFKIAVDNFILEGHSVLDIQRSPLDVIKIGRTFLQDIENNAVMERHLDNLMKYSKTNNKVLIAEGIEDAVSLNYVKSKKLRYGSGYYFAKPLNTIGFKEYIARKQWLVELEKAKALEEKELPKTD